MTKGLSYSKIIKAFYFCWVLWSHTTYTSICHEQRLNETAAETHANPTVATKLPEVTTHPLSKSHLLDHKLMLSADDATYLPQIIVQPDVLWVLPQAVFPPLRGRAATGPAAGKSERGKIPVSGKYWEGKAGWGARGQPTGLQQEKGKHKLGCCWCLTSPWESAWWATGHRTPKGWKSRWKHAHCLPGSPVTARYPKCRSLIPLPGKSLYLVTQQHCFCCICRSLVETVSVWTNKIQWCILSKYF